MTIHILVTGSTGFIGSGVIRRLSQDAMFSVSAMARRHLQQPDGIRQILVPDLAYSSLADILIGVDVVVHAAACAHLKSSNDKKLIEKYQSVNVQATLRLAEQAAADGVRRFIFISSIAVNGGQTFGNAYTEDDEARPVDHYATSKWEAERGLVAIGAATGMEIVILRPPLVYGRGAPGNFGRLLAIAKRGIWLPLGAVHNRRTVISLTNLVDLIALCAHHPAAANEVFLVGDAEDISTSALLRLVAQAMGKKPRLLPIPPSILRFFALIFGKSSLVDKICGDLQVDTTKVRRLLGWIPPANIYTEMKLLRGQMI